MKVLKRQVFRQKVHKRQVFRQELNAKQIEGKNNIGTVLRVQQAYHFERQRFSDNFDNLGLTNGTFKLSQQVYYDIKIVDVQENKAIVTAIPKNKELKAYAGIIQYENRRYKLTQCETKSPSQTIQLPTENGCGNDSIEID